ncbi:MAG: glycerol-3-phosphate dehydrogenase, partial [Selenomonas sp.]|nr:glycerol-3-phosphate dehydrogenase [Selenomonas sp.]
EGVYTVEALMDLAREYRVELPICETVYEIVHNHQDPKDQLTQLFMRSTKSELA